jgi:hypothetical protein
VTSWVRRLTDRLTGRAVPEGFTGELAPEEHVVAMAPLGAGGHLMATSHGLWVPDGRRISWHLISKVTWGEGRFTVIEADVVGEAGGAVLLRDRPAVRYIIDQPGKLPEAVHRRVTGSIRATHHRELPGGGAWFVQRKVPGQDGVVLQVRADEGTDMAMVERLAAEVAERMRVAEESARS